MSTRFAVLALLATACSLDVLPSEGGTSQVLTLRSDSLLTVAGTRTESDAAWVGGDDGAGGPALFEITGFQDIRSVPLPSSFETAVTAISDDAMWVGGNDVVARPGGRDAQVVAVPGCGPVLDLAGAGADLWVVCEDTVVRVRDGSVVQRSALAGVRSVATLPLGDGLSPADPTAEAVAAGSTDTASVAAAASWLVAGAEPAAVAGTENLMLTDVATWTFGRSIAVGMSATGPLAVVLRPCCRLERLVLMTEALAVTVDEGGQVYVAEPAAAVPLLVPEPTRLQPLLDTDITDVSAGRGFLTLVGPRPDAPGSTVTRISLPLRIGPLPVAER